MTLQAERERAVSDLLAAERELRAKSEETVRELRQLLLETAIRLDGERLEAIRREDPGAPGNWTSVEWRSFLQQVTPASAGWGVPSSKSPAKRERELTQQVEELKTQIDHLVVQLEEERDRIVSPEIAVPGNQDQTPEIDLPSSGTSALSRLVEDVKRVLPNLPSRPPTTFSKMLNGGGRVGGDLGRAFQRYWIILYLIGHWKLSASMELEDALGSAVGVSSGSGSLRRVLDDLAKANILSSETLSMGTPRTALKLYRLSLEGERLYEVLFQEKLSENDWSKLVRLHEGDRFKEHTLGVLIFTMHARKRGWATQVLPEVDAGEKAVPDCWVGRGSERSYVEVELSEKELVSKWRNQAALNGGKAALCASTTKSRHRLIGDCKLDNLSGVATDLETLVRTKYKTIDQSTPLWVEKW